jgi:tRNA pseudouridine38-40 synthase
VSRYFLHLAYFGKNYNGWQVQKNSVHTVQQAVEEALEMILRGKIEVTGCGRTDTGVHASSFFAHFDTEKEGLHTEKEKWLRKFNRVISPDIVFYDIRKVKEEANARFDALTRSYRYCIHTRKNPFLQDHSTEITVPLDLDAMNEAAQVLFDYEDFTSFSKVHTQTHTNNCKIYKAEWHVKNDRLLFEITANRFLRNMVRAIVGTLLMVGEKKIGVKEFREIIESKNRGNAGKSVPARGLYLTEVNYPNELFID